MPYNIYIYDDRNKPMAGFLTVYDLNNNAIAEYEIAAGGSSLDESDIENADHYVVTAPGFYWFGVEMLTGDNSFTLVRKPETTKWVVLAAAAGFLFAKLLKFRL